MLLLYNDNHLLSSVDYRHNAIISDLLRYIILNITEYAIIAAYHCNIISASIAIMPRDVLTLMMRVSSYRHPLSVICSIRGVNGVRLSQSVLE